MRQRTITAIFFAAAMIGGIYGGKYTFFALFGIVCAGSLWELAQMLFLPAAAADSFRKTALTLLGLVLYGYAGYTALFSGAGDVRAAAMQTTALYLFQWVLGGVFVLFLYELFSIPEKPFRNIGNYLTGVFYVAIPLALLADIACPDGAYLPNRVFGLIWLVWTNDTMAYLVGSKLGKTKMMERISPKKTWEGTLSGVVGTILMAWLLSVYVPDYTTLQWVILGAVVAIFGMVGDLVESMLKRSVGVKDSGALLPGHGGLLDRFDAFIFVLPFVWLALQWVKG